jgi:hypothetical protein
MAIGRSRHKVGRGYIGQVPDTAWDVLLVAYTHGLATSSNMARILAPEVAMAASNGWITNISQDGTLYSNSWHITMEGLRELNGHFDTGQKPTKENAPTH